MKKYEAFVIRIATCYREPYSAKKAFQAITKIYEQKPRIEIRYSVVEINNLIVDYHITLVFYEYSKEEQAKILMDFKENAPKKWNIKFDFVLQCLQELLSYGEQ
ncbi:hypothetical protein V9L05_20485 [Bernardetia sp. Wsw4-3y2]|uniref:hypothetical protein n=1 Tax=Bernardetia sp. Wsw4-3y2 TaxID=3127471 RepID=UPI0030CDF156